MKKIESLVASLHLPTTKSVVSGVMLLAMFQMPVMPTYSNSALPLVETAQVSASQVESGHNVQLASVFFGEEAHTEKTRTTINEKIEFVRTRQAFPASLKVIQKHENTIREKAREHGIPQDVAIGIGLLENGGSETAKSPAGALGVFQLMPGTARNLGLKVSGKVDERRNPEKNIDAGMRYLAMNYERFGDWGLTTWSYHAGEGNVAKALKLYAKANHGINLQGIKNFPEMKAYVKEHNITIHKLLSDPAVKTLTKKLNDDSSGYPFKVIATASLFQEAAIESQTAVLDR